MADGAEGEQEEEVQDRQRLYQRLRLFPKRSLADCRPDPELVAAALGLGPPVGGQDGGGNTSKHP